MQNLFVRSDGRKWFIFFPQLYIRQLMERNAVMLEETKDTITVPAAFMIRMLACIHSLRNRRSNVRSASEAAPTGPNLSQNDELASERNEHDAQQVPSAFNDSNTRRENDSDADDNEID